MSYMKPVLFLLVLLAARSFVFSQPADAEHIPVLAVPATPHEISAGLQRLLKAYPDHLREAAGNRLVWKDGTAWSYDDGRPKTFEMRLNAPDLEDQMWLAYPTGQWDLRPARNVDPGRIRHAPFFLKMYGNSPAEVKKKLASVAWLPGTLNKTVMITRVNGVNLKLKAVSSELDRLPGPMKKFISTSPETFNWRNIAGSGRLSPHSFGIALDINPAYGNYWRWDLSNTGAPIYKNKIPFEIVEIFEKHGFIWGGKWYHHDTIHFEYRPELFK